MTVSAVTIDPLENARAAEERLEAKLPFDGGYPEDVREDLRNAWRGRRAFHAVLMYAERDGHAEGEPMEQYVRDLLTDLMHLVDLFEPAPEAEESCDFDSLLDRARRMHGNEAAHP